MNTRKITVCHSSDQHGNMSRIADAYKFGIELYVLTGDFFPNVGRPIQPVIEKRYQQQWIANNIKDFVYITKGRPIICVDGNHDFACLADELNFHGVPNVHKIELGKVINMFGLVWAGYPNIPYIYAEWNHETLIPEMEKVVNQTLSLDPDILVTHPPAQGFLSGGYGCFVLANKLMYTEHKVRWHMMGHVHAAHSINEKDFNWKVSNAATTSNILQIEIEEKEDSK